LGRFGDSDDGETVFRAAWKSAGKFILENGRLIRLFPGSDIVGIPQTFFTLAENEMLLSADFDDDGDEDVVTAGWAYPLSYLEGYRRKGREPSEPDFEANFQFLRIQSLAVYDIEADGDSDLVVLFSGNPNLVIYEIRGDRIKYSKELAMPFEPALLVATQDQGVFKQRYLHVLDKTLLKSVAFSSFFPGVYSFSRPSSFQASKSVKLDASDEASQGREFAILVYDDVKVVCEIREEELFFLTSFGYSLGHPTIAIGDFLDDDSVKVVFLPIGG
jgi:hypothetical protein